MPWHGFIARDTSGLAARTGMARAPTLSRGPREQVRRPRRSRPPMTMSPMPPCSRASDGDDADDASSDFRHAYRPPECHDVLFDLMEAPHRHMAPEYIARQIMMPRCACARLLGAGDGPTIRSLGFLVSQSNRSWRKTMYSEGCRE